jgi:hypothetical protein
MPVPTPFAASAFATVIDGFVFDITVTNEGSGYPEAPGVGFSGGGGNGAQAVAIVADGMVTNVSTTDAGMGYITPPAVMIDPPSTLNGLGPSGVVAEFQVDCLGLTPGLTYQLESSPTLPAVWTNSVPSFVAVSNTVSIYLNVGTGNQFFRLARMHQ